jgi:hypothetical protein
MVTAHHSPVSCSLPILYFVRMHLGCLFRRHRPILNSIVGRQDGYAAICDGCGLTIERTEHGKWMAAPPLISRKSEPA